MKVLLIVLLMASTAFAADPPCDTQENCVLLSMFYKFWGVRSINGEDIKTVGCSNKIIRTTTDVEELRYICGNECQNKYDCDLWDEYSYDDVEALFRDNDEPGLTWMVRCYGSRVVAGVKEKDLGTVCR